MSALDPLEFLPWETELHGHRVIYRMAGNGPPVVLIHGMVNSSVHWEPVALRLAEDHTVIAPDLIGHGDSAAVRGDYSLGAHASSIRDLLAALGVERATIVGHSLGGGIAMQFFYQFPQRTERLALISSGGLGREVSPMLRGAAMPGRRGGPLGGRPPPPPRCALEVGERMRERGRGLGVYLVAIARALATAAAGGGTPRLPPDAALGDRLSRPARQRPRPALPARRVPDPDRLGRARPHDPARPRSPGPRGDPGEPLRDPAARRALSPHRGSRGARGRAARVPADHRAGPDRGRRLGRGDQSAATAAPGGAADRASSGRAPRSP